MRSEPTLASLADRLLTREPVVRRSLGLWITSVATYVLYAGLLCVQVALGYTPAEAARWLIVSAVLINAAFYVGIRFGLGPQGDRHLGVCQLLVGIVYMWINYAVAGPAAGATIIIMASHIVYALFGLATKRVWQIVAFSLSGLGLTMWLCHQWQPERYPAGLQLVAFGYAALVATLIARLASLVTHMNHSLRTKRSELAAAFEKLRLLATRDDLTQVHNRRHMTELLQLAQHQHERSGAAMCVAVLDIDHFKSINDRYGHTAGDEVLRRFAQATLQALRTSDVLGRWGGEEFVVLLTDTSLAAAQQAVLRVRERVGATDFGSSAPELRITFSTGLAQLKPGESIDSVLERADQAMYRAKAEGRDRIVLAAQEAPHA